MIPLEFLAALPALGAANKTLLRNALVQRPPYILGDDEDPTDLVALTEGALPKVLGYQGALFWLDPNDHTTEHDGTTCIVTSDGYRYKVNAVQVPYSVLDWQQDDPPESPEFGDAYLTSAAPSGDWADHPEEIAVYTARGWMFAPLQVGQFVYVISINSPVHLDSNGDIVIGLGQQQHAPSTVPFSAAIGWGGMITVENTTTNSPPSAGQGVAYIVGSSPTGAWSGYAGYVAVRETPGTSDDYTLYAPQYGWRAYNKAVAGDVQFNGTNWVAATGRWRMTLHAYTSNGNFSKHSRCFGVLVWCIGGGGGGGVAQSGSAGAGSNGGNSSFGSHCSANGGNGGGAGNSLSGGGGGGASNGNLNLTGGVGGGAKLSDEVGSNFEIEAPGGVTSHPFGRAGQGGRGRVLGSGNSVRAVRGGGAGGLAVKWITASDLGSTETVTRGAGGSGGTAAGTSGDSGQNGLVVVMQFIEN